MTTTPRGGGELTGVRPVGGGGTMTDGVTTPPPPGIPPPTPLTIGSLAAGTIATANGSTTVSVAGGLKTDGPGTSLGAVGTSGAETVGGTDAVTTLDGDAADFEGGPAAAPCGCASAATPAIAATTPVDAEFRFIFFLSRRVCPNM
jgi:hypothetical protein